MYVSSFITVHNIHFCTLWFQETHRPYTKRLQYVSDNLLKSLLLCLTDKCWSYKVISAQHHHFSVDRCSGQLGTK